MDFVLGSGMANRDLRWDGRGARGWCTGQQANLGSVGRAHGATGLLAAAMCNGNMHGSKCYHRVT